MFSVELSEKKNNNPETGEKYNTVLSPLFITNQEWLNPAWVRNK